MRPERAATDRPGNLFEPVHEFHATHGPFDHIAKSRSRALWMAIHRGLVLAAGLLLPAAIAAAVVWAIAG
jgi:hypothetical protein